jgi:hypothetical protein
MIGGQPQSFWSQFHMNSCQLGFLTSEEIGLKWMSLGIVRSPNFRFYSVEFCPDRHVFSDCSIIDSSFQLPSIDLIKTRRYAELPDESYISVISDKELSSCSSLSATVLNHKFDYPEWQFAERFLSSYIRTHRVALVNGTIFTTFLPTGDSVRVLLQTSTRKLFVVNPSTSITYTHCNHATDPIEFPTFRELAVRFERMVNCSLNTKQNLHPKGCVICGNVGSGRSFLVKYTADQMKLRFHEIHSESVNRSDIVFEIFSRRIQPKTIVLLKDFFFETESAFERRFPSELSSCIDRSNQVFFLQ